VNAWDAAAAVGETAAASTSPPIGATVMLPVLRAAFKDVLLVDATFRRQRLAGHDGPIIQVGAPDFHPDSAERGFYRRFRQAGGHLPLFWFDDAHMVAALSSTMEAGTLNASRHSGFWRCCVGTDSVASRFGGVELVVHELELPPPVAAEPWTLRCCEPRHGYRMKAPARLLVVTPVVTHPATQGNSARIQALGQQLLSRGIAPELLYYGMEGLTARQEAAMSAFWSRFHFVKSTPLPPPSLGSCWGVDDWCPDQLRERVRSLHARNRYAAVLVNYVWMSRVLVDLAGVLRIIDTRDLFGDRHLVCRAVGLEPRWFFTSAAEEVRGSNGRTAASRGANAGAGPGPFPGTPCRRWGTTPARA
jgi:hypothetical protein